MVQSPQKNYFKTLLTLSTLTLLLGCGDKGQFAASSFEGGRSGKDLTGVVPEPPAKSVCYGSRCLPTIAIEDVAPVNKDYIYPDPEEFPTANLRPLYISPVAVIDLTTFDQETKISPNFSFLDFMSVDKGRYGLFSPFVAEQMQKMRDSVKRAIFIHSGYRSPGYNARQNGAADWSRHTYGDAVDFEVSGKKVSSLPDLCKRHSASFTLTYTTHVHCDWRMSPKDQSLFPPQMELESFGEFDMASLIALMSRIELTQKNGQWVLSTVIVMDEDTHAEGELTHDWTIRDPQRGIIKATGPEIMIEPSLGEVQVELLVGGSIRLERTIRW